MEVGSVIDIRSIFSRVGLLLGVMLSGCVWVCAQSQGNFTAQGRYELSRGRYTTAIELLNRSLEMSRFNSEAYFLRGIGKYELGDLIGAENDFARSIELNPKNHEALLYRGVCRSQLLRFREAFDDYNRAIRMNNEDERVYSNRALASLHLERYVDVISDCNRIIELEKDNSYTYLLRGEAKAGLEMYRVAIADFNRAALKDSTDMYAPLHRGKAYIALEEFDLGIADLEQAMALDPENALPVFHRGIAYMKLGKYDAALTDLNLVLSRFPDNEVVLFNRAMLYGSMNRNAEALEDYRRVIQLNPSNILAYFNRAGLWLKVEDNARALEDFEKAIERFPEFLDAHEARIELLVRLSQRADLEKAMAAYEKLREQRATTDEETKLEQRSRLLKLTELRGDFKPAPSPELGKLQYKKVDIRLLPFYCISIFPELDSNIKVYDGFGRPHYTGGTLVLTASDNYKEGESVRVVDHRGLIPIRSATADALEGRFVESYPKIDTCLLEDSSAVVCYFARATLYQLELNRLLNDENALLLAEDSLYQLNMERLVAKAELDYRKVLELDPDMSYAHFNLGHLLATAERYEEAETQFGQAATLAGNFIEANYNRGLIRILLGEIEKGCQDLSLAGELGLTDAYNVIKRYCE